MFKISIGFVQVVRGRDVEASMWLWKATDDQPQNWRETEPEDLGQKEKICDQYPDMNLYGFGPPIFV